MSPFKVARDKDKLALESVVRELALLATHIPEDYLEPLTIGTPTWRLKRSMVYAVSIGAAVTGFALLMWGERAFTPLDGADVFLSSLTYSVPAFLAFVTASVFMLKGRSSSHTELIANFTIALIGFPLLGVGTMLSMNGFLDQANSTVHRVEIVDKRISRSSRSTSYFIDVESWRAARDRERLSVQSNEYDRMTVGSTMRIETKPGRLGFEWLADHSIDSRED